MNEFSKLQVFLHGADNQTHADAMNKSDRINKSNNQNNTPGFRRNKNI